MFDTVGVSVGHYTQEVLKMRALILSSRCDGDQNRAISALREALEARGDICEALDWLAFMSDTVLQINAASGRRVRRRFQELLKRGSAPFPDAREHAGVNELIEVSAKELGRFLTDGGFELAVCAEPMAAVLLRKAAKNGTLSVRTVFVACGGSAGLTQSDVGLDLVLTENMLCASESGDTAYEALRALVCGMPSQSLKNAAPTIQSSLRHNILKMPDAVYEASGIVVNGRRLKSFVFSTNLAIIRNCDADAVFAVYPFTPQQAISEAIIKAAYVPVFCGVGGGTTKGIRTVGLAKDAEAQGAMGLVLNAPISDINLRAVASAVDIPVAITVVSDETDIARRIEYGAAIINVAGAGETPEIVKKIRDKYPDLPIIASGGSTDESIRKTIRAGANAVTYTPPSTKELFRATMSKYREL